jgi:hypothetical protein
MSNREDRPELQRDAALERVWRAASTEQPSARLDAAILAAAREAVTAPRAAPLTMAARVPAQSRWNRWAPMAVAAAVAGLAFTLVQTLPREPARAPAPDVQESAAPAAQESAAPVTQKSATPAAPEVAPTLAPAQTSSAERQETAAPRASGGDHSAARQMASPPAVSATPQSLPVEANEQRGSVEDRGSFGAARSKAADAALTEGVLQIDEWVQKVVALHAAGDVAAATEALRAFRAVEPGADRHLPESLREWAASVR